MEKKYDILQLIDMKITIPENFTEKDSLCSLCCQNEAIDKDKFIPSGFLNKELSDSAKTLLLERIEKLQYVNIGKRQILHDIKSKIITNKKLNKDESGYFLDMLNEMKRAETRNRKWKLHYIKKMRYEGVGDNEIWKNQIKILKSDHDLDEQDLKYFNDNYEKFKEYDVEDMEIIELKEEVRKLLVKQEGLESSISATRGLVGLNFALDAYLHRPRSKMD